MMQTESLESINKSLRTIVAIGMFIVGFFLSTITTACFRDPLEWWWTMLISAVAGGIIALVYWKDTETKKGK